MILKKIIAMKIAMMTKYMRIQVIYNCILPASQLFLRSIHGSHGVQLQDRLRRLERPV